MPRKKSAFTAAENTGTLQIDHIITVLSLATLDALGDSPATLYPAKVVVGPVTFSGLRGGSVIFSAENLPLKALNTLLDMLQKNSQASRTNG